VAIAAGLVVSCGVVAEEEAAQVFDDGIVMIDEGRWEEAVDAFSQVIDLDPGGDTDCRPVRVTSGP
jgi:hypothetical protein